MQILVFNTIAIVSSIICTIILFRKKILDSTIWHATVTPLASIIGSGFLVSAPILILTTGQFAPFVMLVIVSIAYALGASIRFNIKNIEPMLLKLNTFSPIKQIEMLSLPCLGVAYIISVTFYIKLLSAFALRGLGIEDLLYEKLITTAILLFIGITGRLGGLKSLVSLETYAVNLKLAIIFAILMTFLVYNSELFVHGTWTIKSCPQETWWMGFRKILGMLIIIQGFETSRYIGYGYKKPTRIKTMRYAQLLSGAIYVLFVSLSMVVFTEITKTNETAIIDLCKIVAPILAPMLIIAAIMSQFSAAIADTLGSGGLIVIATRSKLNINNSYFFITILAISLTWLTNIYSILTLASKAFAVYYAMQILLTIVYLKQQKQIKNSLIKIIGYTILLLLMILIITLGIPVN